MAAWKQKRRDAETLEERRVNGTRMVVEEGLSEHEVARKLGTSQQAVSKWIKAYMKGGNSYDVLNRKKRTGNPRKLTEKQLAKLPEMLLKGAEYWGFSTDVWTAERIAKLIRVHFEVKYNSMYLTRILHSLGLSWQKVEKAAREQDRTKLRDWIINTLPK